MLIRRFYPARFRVSIQKLSGTLSAAPPESQARMGAPKQPYGKIFLVDLPGAQQTSIRVMSHAWAKGGELRVKEELAAKIIGGSFTSRLNSLLREQKSYTYGARCRFVESAIGGQFIASTSVQTKFTAPALTDLLGVINNITFTEEELNKSKKLMRSDFISSNVGLQSIASQMDSMASMEHPPDRRGLELRLADTVSLESLNSTTPLFHSARGVIVLIGDREKCSRHSLKLALTSRYQSSRPSDNEHRLRRLDLLPKQWSPGVGSPMLCSAMLRCSESAEGQSQARPLASQRSMLEAPSEALCLAQATRGFAATILGCNEKCGRFLEAPPAAELRLTEQ